jgi:hypothetical protein
MRHAHIAPIHLPNYRHWADLARRRNAGVVVVPLALTATTLVHQTPLLHQPPEKLARVWSRLRRMHRLRVWRWALVPSGLSTGALERCRASIRRATRLRRQSCFRGPLQPASDVMLTRLMYLQPRDLLRRRTAHPFDIRPAQDGRLLATLLQMRQSARRRSGARERSSPQFGTSRRRTN